MGQYLIDNNIISNFFSGKLSLKAMILVGDIIDLTPNISIITEIEALSWVNSDKNKENIIKEFIKDSKVFNLNAEITAKTINIRRGRKIKTPDAIIAATAIVNNFTLVTNDNDFNGIQNLELISLSSL